MKRMKDMIEEYRRALKKLYERREELCRDMLNKGQRLRVLDEEIEETEEALMYMREYAAV